MLDRFQDIAKIAPFEMGFDFEGRMQSDWRGQACGSRQSIVVSVGEVPQTFFRQRERRVLRIVSKRGAQPIRSFKMRLLAAVAIFPFLVAPAFAQSPGSNQQQSGPNAAGTQTIQQQVRDNLQQAGFTDIKIMPSSFLVRAKDRAGNPVMMVINPDSVTAVTEMSGGSPQSGAASGGGANPSSAQNSGAGIPGKPGNKSGPAVRPPSGTTGQGANSNQSSGSGSSTPQDASKVPGLPGNKSGPAVRPPSGSSSPR